MGTHSRRIQILAVVGVLALGAASTARAQQSTNAPPKDTSAAARSDTSGYKSYQNPTDTLRLQPDSMRKADDTTSAAGQAAGAGAMDTVVCKDGAHAVVSACDAVHAGIDSVATKAAKKARGKTAIPDTRDTSSSSPQQ